MTPVVVVTVNPDCPAHLALSAEGVSHELALCRHDTDYGDHVASRWRAGHGFILLDYDVAPWPGAVQQLTECGRDWCTFRYPKGGHLVRSLGCTKFSTRLVQAWPELPERWKGVGWRTLESHVLAAVADVLRAEQPDRKPVCEHAPPVAHVRPLEA